MFPIRLFPYVLSIFPRQTAPVPPGAAVPKELARPLSVPQSVARSSLSTKSTTKMRPSSPPPEWPCLEECKNIEEQVARIQTLFLQRGGDINQKHPVTKKSALHELLTFHHDLTEFKKLSSLFFQHGAKIDPSEYNDESPFSHIFYTSRLEKEAVAKITILANLGVSLKIKNVRGETLLQTAKRIQFSRDGIAKIHALIKKQIASEIGSKKT